MLVSIEASSLSPEIDLSFFANGSVLFPPLASSTASLVRTTRFQNVSTFGLSGAIAVKNRLYPTLFSNVSVFYSPTIAKREVVPIEFVNVSVFYSPHIHTTLVLAPTKFTNTSTFGADTIHDIPIPLHATAFTNISVFGSPDIAPDQFRTLSTGDFRTIDTGSDRTITP